MALDLLRFGCALMVLAFHWGNGFAFRPPPGGQALLAGMPVDAGWAPLVNSGWIGVELFFVVSGFVIAWSAEGSGAAAFARRRFLRLVPAAWLCASMTAAALLAFDALAPGTTIALWLGSLLFWPMFGIDPSYWTLAIEVNFYLLVALSLRGGSTLARIERVGTLLGVASALYWIAGYVAPVPPATDRIVQLTLLPHGCFFALGILIRSRQQLGPRSLWWLYLAPACAAALIEIEAHRVVMNGNSPVWLPPLLLFACGLLPILLAEKLQPWLARHARASHAATLGLMTYPLYLLHQELGALSIGGMLHLGARYWPAAALAFVAMLVLTWAVVRFGEPPLRSLLKRWLDKRAPGSDEKTGWGGRILHQHFCPKPFQLLTSSLAPQVLRFCSKPVVFARPHPQWPLVGRLRAGTFCDR
ncbi:peptidoglycan/LPS O-acetylase OafA/YrhL [Sphingomonas naasensis]|nr:acyltransferase [Sphingomonas naasensis]NIJ21069.1 peptidoglycan/LPS O-acetylase OafA/YrhL [Sphingomonas naasensis]